MTMIIPYVQVSDFPWVWNRVLKILLSFLTLYTTQNAATRIELGDFDKSKD